MFHRFFTIISKKVKKLKNNANSTTVPLESLVHDSDFLVLKFKFKTNLVN